MAVEKKLPKLTAQKTPGMLGLVACCVMMFLYSAQSIVITYSKNDSGGYNYKPNSVVLMVEFTKLAIATFGLGVESIRGNEPQMTFDKRGLLYAVPALLYAAHNNLVFLGLEALDAPTYQLLNNIKIVIAGILYRLVLNKSLTVLQWLGIFLLTLGQAVATLKTDGKTDSEKQASFLYGLSVMCFLSCLSAFAGIYSEKLLKGSSDSLYFQNSCLYFFGTIFCFLQHLRTSATTIDDSGVDGDMGFFHGFEASTWLVVLTSALMGQAVSVVLKICDNITNRFATAASLIVTSVVSNMLFHTPIQPPFIIGVLVIAVAFALYYVPNEFMVKMDTEIFPSKDVKSPRDSSDGL